MALFSDDAAHAHEEAEHSIALVCRPGAGGGWVPGGLAKLGQESPGSVEIGPQSLLDSASEGVLPCDGVDPDARLHNIEEIVERETLDPHRAWPVVGAEEDPSIGTPVIQNEVDSRLGLPEVEAIACGQEEGREAHRLSSGRDSAGVGIVDPVVEAVAESAGRQPVPQSKTIDLLAVRLDVAGASRAGEARGRERQARGDRPEIGGVPARAICQLGGVPIEGAEPAVVGLARNESIEGARHSGKIRRIAQDGVSRQECADRVGRLPPGPGC